MNFLFLSGHPAQIHNLRVVKHELELLGHNVFWIATSKDISKYLLDYYGINYQLISKPQKKFFSKIFTLLGNTVNCIRFIKKHKINIVISRVSPHGILASFFKNKPHIALADTESSGIYDSIFTSLIPEFITSSSYKRNLKKNQIRFNGNIELFYLHPNRFKPMALLEVKKMLSLNEDEKYVIMRFVSWDAYHDKGLSGFTDNNKIKAVNEFSAYSKVFISAENELPAELEEYRIQIPPERMHDVLAHATLFFGESATMASESAVLGTPAIYLDKVGRGYTDEEEEYGLVYNFKNDLESQAMAIDQGIKLLKDPLLKAKTQEKRKTFVNDKIDPTAFLVWFIENYPQSAKIMKENPNYQYNFK